MFQQGDFDHLDPVFNFVIRFVAFLASIGLAGLLILMGLGLWKLVELIS